MFKNSIKTTLVVLFCIIGWGVMGQTKPVWDWAKALSGNNEDLVWGIAADSRNGVYCYGTTQSDTLRLGAQSLPGLPGKDIFLVKYDTSGTVQWAKRFGNGSNQVVGGITTDLNSNVVICGSFTGTLNIDGISLSSTGGLDVFMAKFRANGTVVWARQFSGNADDRAGRLLCDKQMNIYTVGSYNSTNFSIDAFGLPDANTYNLFYSKLDSTGSAIWAQKGSTDAFCGFYDIQITDNGQATFIGSLQSGGSLNFDPMGGIGLMSPFNSAFVLRANAATGNFISQSLVTGNRYFGSNTAMLSPQKIVFGGYNTFLTLPPTVTAELRDFNTLALQTITQPSVQGGNSTGGGVFLGPQKKIFQVSYTTGTVSYGPNLNLSLSNFVNVICEMDSALTPQNLLPMQYQPGFNANIRLLACDTATGNLYGIGSFSKSVAGGSYQLGSNSLVHQGLTDGMIFKIRQTPSPSPFKAFAGNDTTVCAGDSIFIGHPSGSIGGTPPYTYSWSPTTNLANPTAPFTQASPTSSRSYILTVVDSYGLFTKDTVTVMVKPRPTTPGISVLGSNSICWGDSATLVCTWPGGSGTYFFDWYRNGHFVQRLVNNPQFKVGESGMYAVKLIEDGSECPSLPSAPVAITVSAPLLGADTTIYQACYGDSTNLLPLYNTAGLTAVWNTATPHAVLPGVYRLSVSNANNCRDTAFVTVKLEVAMWTGAVNSDWHTPGNWNINKVPSTVTHVIISNGTPNNCVISAANATVASLQLRNGASLTMGNGMQVTMVGNCAVLPPG